MEFFGFIRHITKQHAATAYMFYTQIWQNKLLSPKIPLDQGLLVHLPYRYCSFFRRMVRPRKLWAQFSSEHYAYKIRGHLLLNGLCPQKTRTLTSSLTLTRLMLHKIHHIYVWFGVALDAGRLFFVCFELNFKLSESFLSSAPFAFLPFRFSLKICLKFCKWIKRFLPPGQPCLLRSSQSADGSGNGK